MTASFLLVLRNIASVLHNITLFTRSTRGAGVDIDPALGTGKQLSLRLAERGVLVKDTHGSTLRFAPPLVITEAEIDWAVDRFTETLAEMAS